MLVYFSHSFCISIAIDFPSYPVLLSLNVDLKEYKIGVIINIINKKITLIFGCREEKNILYYKELKLLEEINPNFNYYISLSREKTNKHTNGYVQDILNELHKNNNFKNVDFFICGTGNMVNSVKQNLFDKGFNKENIHLEIYV